MRSKQILVAYTATALVFLALDSVWLTLMADRLYRPALAHLMISGGGFNPVPAALFYVIYVAAIVGFAIAPGLAAQGKGWVTALGRGAAFGFVAYATYDLTNQATLRDWPWVVTLADLAWGSTVTGVSAALACAITAHFAPRSPG